MKWKWLFVFCLLSTVVKAQIMEQIETGRYRYPVFAVKEILDLQYATVKGYWSELKDDDASPKMFMQLTKTLNERELNLFLDVYSPQDDTLRYHPLVMLIHGGAFYYETRKEKSVTAWCKYLASLGYVAVTIDYRIGFQPSLSGIERAGYRAAQDAHAAMRYLVHHSEPLGIDTSMMFVGGCSAGAITALNLMFMSDKTRPGTSYSGFLKEDLGDLESSGNDIQCSFDLKGVVDMWGAIYDLHLLDGNKKPILAFHGDADNIVPYDYNYPFQMVGEAKKVFFNKMYGSSSIVEYAKRQGAKAQLYTFRGFRHAPHINKKTKQFNENFYFIQDKMTEFFRNVMEELNGQQM